MDSPLVSISCITFNHSSFIRECIEGFISQKTNFPYEIVIYDDHSTDGTSEIVREYAERYPKLVSLVVAKENQYSKGVRGIAYRFNFPRCKGKYIALCEGDDYWIDSLKLQKQVDFLETNPIYSASVHGAKIFNENEGSYQVSKYENHTRDEDLEMFRIFKESGGVYPTCSLLFKKENLIYPENLMNFSGGDLIFIIFLAKQGKIRFLKETMAVYRVHNGGVYQGEEKNLFFYLSNRRELKHFYRELSCHLDISNKLKLYFFVFVNYLSMFYLQIKLGLNQNLYHGDK
jgi:glycosyltransferase involved in cell wall biosynthesis